MLDLAFIILSLIFAVISALGYLLDEKEMEKDDPDWKVVIRGVMTKWLGLAFAVISLLLNAYYSK